MAGFAVAVAAAGLVIWAFIADGDWFERHFLADYCVAAYPAWPFLTARALAVALALLLYIVVRPRVARMPGVDLAGVGIAIALGLGVGELLLRLVRWDDAHEGGDRPAVRPDARVGWVPAPFQVKGRYRIDAWGDRIDRPIDPSARSLVVAGESIAFGWRLDWNQTFAAQVGSALGLQVVNVAVPSYADDQAYLRLVDALDRLSHPRVVVFLFIALQIRRNLVPVRPHLVLDGGRLVTAPAEPTFALKRLMTDRLYHGDAPLATTRAILEAAADAARAHGARPLFVIPNYGPACPDDRIVRELFAGLPAIRVDLGAGDFFDAEKDWHPNARGARKIADAILLKVRP